MGSLLFYDTCFVCYLLIVVLLRTPRGVPKCLGRVINHTLKICLIVLIIKLFTHSSSVKCQGRVINHTEE